MTGRLWGLTSALTTDERTGLTGAQYTAPLREDMLRALSQSVPPDARNGLAQQRLTTVGRTVDDLFGAVTIVNPGGSYTLATEHSPLPLALRNDLPVPIRVRLQIDAPPGMSVTDMGEIELPPGYLPLKVPIEVHFTQRVAVDVALRTADGLPLGEPVRLSVHSNAYGKVLFFITLSAGAVLVLLAGRRLWHRFRGQPDRADLDRPDPIDVAIAYAKDTDEPPRAMSRSAGGKVAPVQPAVNDDHRGRAASAAATAVQQGPAAPLPTPRDRAGVPADAAARPRHGCPAGPHRGGGPGARNCPTRRWCPGRGAWRSRLWSAGSPASPASCCWPPSSAPRCRSAFSVANQLPNLIAALVLEATFTAIFVPVLARAERDDPDGGTAFVRRLVTLATALLLVVTAAVGGRRSAAGSADAGQRPAGQPVADHRVRLPAAAPGVLLRPVVGVHGDPEHPQRLRPAGLGAGGATTSSRSPRWGCMCLYRASFRSIPSRWAMPSCWCSASAPRSACSPRPRCCWWPSAGSGSACARCGASTTGSRSSARWPRPWCSTC